jgi:hypothetical protein
MKLFKKHFHFVKKCHYLIYRDNQIACAEQGDHDGTMEQPKGRTLKSFKK